MCYSLKHSVLVIVERRIHKHHDIIEFLTNDMMRVKILLIGRVRAFLIV